MPALKLEDKTFGYWKVLKKDEDGSKAHKQSYWFCECQLCGKVKSVRGSALTTGKSTKCDDCNRHKVLTDEVGEKYNHLSVKSYVGMKNNRKMWLCQCDCGNFIEVSTTDLRTGAVQSCGKCPGKESLGENCIKNFLINGKIDFIQEHSFEDFKYENGHFPRFDFYIPSHNYIIEYDGKQHFEYSNNSSSWNNEYNFYQTQKNDKIKNEYCFSHNIPIIRIPYNKLNEITIFVLIPETSEFLLQKESV